MAKKCPPGVICVENITLLFVLIVLGLVVLFINNKNVSNNVQREKVVINETEPQQKLFGLFPRPSFTFSNVSSDVLLNPYEPPLRDDRIFRTNIPDPRGVPINIRTQGVETDYRQIGILTRVGAGSKVILPLMGRPVLTNRDKWNFYTMSEQNNMVKLPISNKGRSCTNEYGCDNLYNGDTVYVEGYNDTFKVTVYENQTMRYIPFL
tara:strand:- start:29 stop:649 length:621 start_codon:yes stop_codon:yes gene_type:complete